MCHVSCAFRFGSVILVVEKNAVISEYVAKEPIRQTLIEITPTLPNIVEGKITID